MELQAECCKVFSEIDTLNERLSSLGRAAQMVLARMINNKIGLDSITILLAKARKAEGASVVEEEKNENVEEIKEKRRCKWYNRGYCREKERCSFVHPKLDCKDHLQGRCSIRGCTLRHRRVCKFHEKEDGCIRGEMCEYLHHDLPKRNDNIADVLENDEEVEKDVVIMESKATQADDTLKHCVCRKEVEKNELIMEEEKIICLFKRVKCDKDEWEEIDDAVEDSEIDLEEMLDQWSKVMEGYYRRENKAK